MLGPLIAAGSSLIGGWLSSNAQSNANATNAAIAQQNIELQRQFAQNGIRWKVKDAERSGVHPLYALGANTTSFSPVSVGAVPETGMANAMAGMGQNLSRAVAAPQPPEAKVGGVLTAQQIASNSIDLETKKVNLDYVKAKLAALTQPGTPPGVAFDVPENKKPEERPPLMAAGSRWLTNPNTSPAKAYEDQYGDDGPASWLINAAILGNDIIHNIRNSPPGSRRSAGANVDYSELPGRVQQWYQAAKSRYYERR